MWSSVLSVSLSVVSGKEKERGREGGAVREGEKGAYSLALDILSQPIVKGTNRVLDR